jgi:predicted deacylase
MPYRERLVISRTVFAGGDGPRVAIVAGIHGDELEGLYLCQRLAAWLEPLARTRPEALHGRVELYPAMNPLGIDTISREIPVFETDLNRHFPGHPEGILPQRIADALMHSLQGAALVLDVHASNRFLRELPQARVARAYAEQLLPFAYRLNVDLIWLQDHVLETTLKYQLNQQGIPCLVIEVGIAMRVLPVYADQLLVGILQVLRDCGVLTDDAEIPGQGRSPRLLEDKDIRYLNAETAGLFIPIVGHGASIAEGELLGHILSSFQGKPLAEVRAPAGGQLFTLREFPLVYEGSLMGRIAVVQD